MFVSDDMLQHVTTIFWLVACTLLSKHLEVPFEVSHLVAKAIASVEYKANCEEATASVAPEEATDGRRLSKTKLLGKRLGKVETSCKVSCNT